MILFKDTFKRVLPVYIQLRLLLKDELRKADKLDGNYHFFTSAKKLIKFSIRSNFWINFDLTYRVHKQCKSLTAINVCEVSRIKANGFEVPCVGGEFSNLIIHPLSKLYTTVTSGCRNG
jgi:hypothetical protein